MKSLYIHIPFCAHKCSYCDFNSYMGIDNLIEDYIDALIKELKAVIDFEGSNKFYSVYFGGGTPSYIPSKFIKEVMSLINCNGEVTIEVNPGTVTKEKLIDYKSAGINRLSIGLQTTNDFLLKKIGRIHSLEDFKKTYSLARECGFDNISVDLMFGLPSQTIEDVKDSLDFIFKIRPEHISCYSLILHDEQIQKYPGVFNNLPSDEEERNMYYEICNRLFYAGFNQYEISNFAIPGFESKHNLCYWNQNEYYGIGAGASSYINMIRYKNINSVKDYIERLSGDINTKAKIPCPGLCEIEEIQDKETKIKEYMILKLRLIEGVSKEELQDKFHFDVFEYFKKTFNKLVDEGLLCYENHNNMQYVKLTKKGLDLANLVWEEFV